MIDYLVGHQGGYLLLLSFLFIFTNYFYRHRNKRLIKVEWLDENRANYTNTFYREQSGYSYGPLIRDSQRVESVILPAINLYYFKNARVCATSSSILLDNRIIIERVEGVDVERCNFAQGHVVSHSHSGAFVTIRPTEYIDKGIFLAGNGSFNYYHWMIEILVKLEFLQDLNGKYQNFPLLVSEDIANIEPFHQALNFISNNTPIIMLDKKKTYFVSKLVHINSPNKCPFNLREGYRIRVSDFIIRDSSINFLRKQLNADWKTSAKIGPKRIFFARQTGRRNYNQDEIYIIFERYGFTRVFMEELSLRDQIDMVANAEMIAGPTGAAWTNIIFCREGTKCLCWMADEYQDFSAYSNLARIVGADLCYLTHRTDAKSTGELYYMDYHLDPKQVEQVLYRLLHAAA